MRPENRVVLNGVRKGSHPWQGFYLAACNTGKPSVARLLLPNPHQICGDLCETYITTSLLWGSLEMQNTYAAVAQFNNF